MSSALKQCLHLCHISTTLKCQPPVYPSLSHWKGPSRAAQQQQSPFMGTDPRCTPWHPVTSKGTTERFISTVITVQTPYICNLPRMSWRGKDNIKRPARETNKEEQGRDCGVPLVARMPFIFGVCPSSFQEISSYPISMGRYSVTVEPFRREHLRTESGHKVKPVFIIRDGSRARSVEQAALPWKIKRSSEGPWDYQGLKDHSMAEVAGDLWRTPGTTLCSGRDS